MIPSHAVMIQDFGAPESFPLVEQTLSAPGPGKLLLRILAAGVSFVDALVAAGKYQLKPPRPFIRGSECAGVILAVGEGVSLRPGQRVLAAGFGFAFAEAAIIPEKLAIPIPDEMGFVTASVFRVSYATAYYALVQRAALQPGETLLVLGAAGAVGQAAIELGKIFGARVIASASTPEKREAALRAGADAAIDARAANWRTLVKDASGGKGVNVVLDTIGGASTEPAFRSLAWGGRHLIIGFASGEIPKLPVNLALLKGAALLGVDVRQFDLYQPAKAAQNIAALFRLYQEKKLHPAVAVKLPLARFAEALNLASAGETAGRIVLEMGEPHK